MNTLPTILRTALSRDLSSRHIPSAQAFTLVELMVVIVIISILASLMLAGLNTATRLAKISRTESTIRKIHEIIMPQYETYTRRNIQTYPPDSSDLVAGGANMNISAAITLVAKRRMQALEMPERWTDVACLSNSTDSFKSCNDTTPIMYADRVTPISKRFKNIFNEHQKRLSPQSLLDSSNLEHTAECLWMGVMQGGYADPGIVAHFRDDEFGDTNKNGAREFVDGWGKPINFLRWAPGFTSRYQSADMSSQSHDSFDPRRVDPFATNNLVPLIYSAGPDDAYDCIFDDIDKNTNVVFDYSNRAFDPYYTSRLPNNAHLHVKINATKRIGCYTDTTTPTPGSFGTSGAASQDNIHSHSLSR